jgi:hypothetical protein
LCLRNLLAAFSTQIIDMIQPEEWWRYHGHIAKWGILVHSLCLDGVWADSYYMLCWTLIAEGQQAEQIGEVKGVTLSNTPFIFEVFPRHSI